MKLRALVSLGALVGAIAGSACAAEAPALTFEAAAGADYPLGGSGSPDGAGGTFAAAMRAAQSASAAASSAVVESPGLISIVPEPRPYQLLLGGIGAVFYMARRQWKR